MIPYLIHERNRSAVVLGLLRPTGLPRGFGFFSLIFVKTMGYLSPYLEWKREIGYFTQSHIWCQSHGFVHIVLSIIPLRDATILFEIDSSSFFSAGLWIKLYLHIKDKCLILADTRCNNSYITRLRDFPGKKWKLHIPALTRCGWYETEGSCTNFMHETSHRMALKRHTINENRPRIHTKLCLAYN